MNEAKMILKMLDEGKITLEEAEALLEALGTDDPVSAGSAEGRLRVGETVPSSEKRTYLHHEDGDEYDKYDDDDDEDDDDDDDDEEEEIEELVDQIEEEIDHMEDQIDHLEDQLVDELDALRDEWDELEDVGGVDDNRREELRKKMDDAREQVESRRDQLREERKRIREQAREYKRQVRTHQGINEEIHAGMRELSRGLDEVRQNFQREGLPELRAAMRQLSEELNEGLSEGMNELRHGLNEGAKEVRRAFGGSGFRNLLNGIFSSISWSGNGISLEDEITGQFDPAAGPVEIDIRTSNGRIEVFGTDEAGYRLQLHYTIPADSEEEAQQLKGEMVSITQEANRLKVRTLEFRRGSVAATLYLPKSTEGNIKLHTSNGRITIEELRSKGCLQLETSNGRITLTGVRVKDLRANTSNGRVELRDVASDVMDVDTSNGSIFVEGICENVVCRTSNGAISAYPYVMDRGSLKLSTSNGRIKVVLKNMDMGLDVETTTTMGSITLDVPDLEYERKLEKHHRHDYKAHTKGFAEMEKQLRIQAVTSMGSIYVGQGNE